MRTAEEFKQIAIDKEITYWQVHECSICKYKLGFIFFQFKGDDVVYDHGCHCLSKMNMTRRTWEDVAKQYNCKTFPATIAEYNDFWGFVDAD